MISVRMKSPGWGGFFMGMAASIDNLSGQYFKIGTALSTRAAQKRAENLAGHARPLQSNSLVGVGHAQFADL